MSQPTPSPTTRAVVTGASSGIGAALSESLARRGHSLVLVARRKDRLEALAERLSGRYRVAADVTPCDLSDRGQRSQLITQLAEVDVSILCLNAGFATYGTLHELDPERELRQIELNVVAVHDLLLHALPRLMDRGSGAVLITGSTAGNQPSPCNATYAASKAFANSLAESIHGELAGTGVTCTLLAPGPVRSEFAAVSRLGNIEKLLPDFAWVSAEAAAEAAVRGMAAGRRRVVPGVTAKVADRWRPACSTRRTEPDPAQGLRRYAMSKREIDDYGVRGGVRKLLELAPRRGLLYKDAHYLAATVEVDPKAVRRWLPAGLRPAEPARADLFCAWFPECSYGSVYHEAGLFVHIKTVRSTGIHCPWMVLDDDVALILGREFLGYPKKLGEISWHLDGEHIEAHASRRGSKLVDMTGTLGETIEDAPPILGRPHRNVIGTLGLALPRIVAFTPGEHPIEVRRVDLDLTLGGSERDPLHLMGLGAVIEARLHRVDLSAGLPPLPLRPLTPMFSVTRLRPRVL